MDFQKALLNELSLSLPGPSYQMLMAPKHRKLAPDSGIKQNAAVAIVIHLSGIDGIKILLTKRAEYNGHHSGQISFPGGKEEVGDKDLIHTAIRETFEEIGLTILFEHFIGKLSPLFVPVSKFMIYPYIFLLPEPENYKLDRSEVDYIVQCKINTLLKDSLIQTTSIEIDGNTITTPYYAIENEIVWGATAMILAEFAEILKRIDRKNPALI